MQAGSCQAFSLLAFCLFSFSWLQASVLICMLPHIRPHIRGPPQNLVMLRVNVKRRGVGLAGLGGLSFNWIGVSATVDPWGPPPSLVMFMTWPWTAQGQGAEQGQKQGQYLHHWVNSSQNEIKLATQDIMVSVGPGIAFHTKKRTRRRGSTDGLINPLGGNFNPLITVVACQYFSTGLFHRFGRNFLSNFLNCF